MGAIEKYIAGENGAADENHRAAHACDRAEAHLRDKRFGEPRADNGQHAHHHSGAEKTSITHSRNVARGQERSREIAERVGRVERACLRVVEAELNAHRRQKQRIRKSRKRIGHGGAERKGGDHPEPVPEIDPVRNARQAMVLRAHDSLFQSDPRK